MIPGLPPIAPSFTGGTATGGAVDGRGNGWSAGDWNVNLAGSGGAMQGAGSLPPWMLIALVVGGAWLLLKR